MITLLLIILLGPALLYLTVKVIAGTLEYQPRVDVDSRTEEQKYEDWKVNRLT